LKGQWIGRYSGNVDGSIMINIDEMGEHYEGRAYLNPDDKSIPSTVAYFGTDNKDKNQEITAYLNPVDPRSGYQRRWEEIKDLFPKGTVHSDTSNIKLIVNKNVLEIDAVSDIGVIVKSIIKKIDINETSKIEGLSMKWSKFKSYVSGLSKKNYLFRGQEKPWPMRTSFHRKGRYRINYFIDHDIKQLHRYLSSKTKHFFDLKIPEQNGAFYNLVQHHGYPTPLLDWTYSPYVSAFFAFKNLPKNHDGNEVVRIFILDNDLWQKNYPQIKNIDPPFPHLSVMEFIALDNDRLIPQQGATTVTNIDDVESYILEQERVSKEKYLYAIDMPVTERETVIQELSYMGITAGSMFPGIDGVCEELRESNFEI